MKRKWWKRTEKVELEEVAVSVDTLLKITESNRALPLSCILRIRMDFDIQVHFTSENEIIRDTTVL